MKPLCAKPPRLFVSLSFLRIFALALVPVLAAFIVPANKARAQADTTAAIGGIVTAGDTHSAIGGARVTLHHAGTGDVFEARTNGSGRYMFIGLRVDDGYSLRVTAPGYDPQDIGPFSLNLGEQRDLDVLLADPASKVVALEKIVVTANREQGIAGAGSTLTESDIEERPGIDQTVNDFATTDPRITMVDSANGEISAAGQNFRFNSLQMDGIRMDDQFGLETNGLPTLGNPFSMETVQSISIDLTPYEVSRGGFTGAAINAVSKSGSNIFAGSGYYTYANEKFRAADPKTGKRTPYTKESYGFTLGGPIIKNHLFFFIAWERQNYTNPATEASFDPNPDDVQRIIDIARNKYGYGAGSLTGAGAKSRKSDTYMAKIDWRISSKQRLSVRYNGSRSTNPTFPNYTSSTETSLSSYWYLTKRKLDGWNAQLFSQWRDNFQTEASFTTQHITADRIPASPWPQVGINGVRSLTSGTGEIWIGTDSDSQANNLSTKNTQGRVIAKWLLGKHRLEFGGEMVKSEFDNTYLPYAWGGYAFTTIDDFAAGKPSNYTYQFTNNGEIPSAKWGYMVNSAFLQDTWRPVRQLTLTAGFRLDYPTMKDRPRENTIFEQTFGMRNDGNIDGAYTFGPRISFNWEPGRSRRLLLRGGVGLFQGRAPGVWLSNAFTNDGVSSFKSSTANPGTFNPNINNRPTLDPSSAIMPVNLMTDGLRLPAIIRGNLAADMKLPWQKMVFSVEWLYSRSYNSLVYRNINLNQTTIGPDGRPLYGTWKVTVTQTTGNTTITHVTNSQRKYSSFDDVYLLTNADRAKDDSQASYLSFSLRRPVQNHWGFDLSYTRGHATEVSPISASTAATNFSRRISTDPNNDETGTSNTEVRDRILTRLTFKFALIRNYDTNIQLIYDAHSGRPYSYSYTNDLNGDAAANTNNDLFYVPSGPNDSKIYWADPTQKAAFFNWLATNNDLRRYAGQIVPRNTERCDFVHSVNLQFTQQFPLWKKLRGEFVFNIINLTNLLNPNWGEVYAYGSPYVMPVLNGVYDPRTGQYRYTFASTPRVQLLQTSPSRWQLQAGIKVKF